MNLFKAPAILFSLLLNLGVFLSLNAWASGGTPAFFTLDGRLYADSAATTPLTDADVNLVIQILNANQTCILYEETQSHFNAAIGNGYFTLQVGSAVGDAKRSSLDSGNSMSQIYSNSVGSIPGRTLGGAACSYSGAVGDLRYVRMLVTPSSDGITRALSPNMALDSVPNAVVAERAENLQGLSPANLLQVNTSGSEVLSQSNLENIFSSSNYSALTALLAGSSALYSKPAANGTTPLANVSSPASPAAGQMWYDSGAIKFYNGSTTQTLGVSGSGITSLVAGTGLNVGSGPGGTITSTGTLNVDTGTTAGQIVQVAAGNKLPVIDGSNLTLLNGSAINSGTIGGSTAVNTTGNIAAAAVTATGNVGAATVTTSGAITATGNITGATVTGTSVVGTMGSFGSTSTGQISLFDHASTNTNYVTIKTPATASLTSDYVLTLPDALPGSPGQVLTSDTSGKLTWTSPSSGSVTSVGGTAPITISGTGAAPVVNVSAATTTTSGVVTLAADGGTTASTVVQATDARLSDARLPSNNSDLLKVSAMPANCAAGSSLTFSSPSGTWVCSVIPAATTTAAGLVQLSGDGGTTAGQVVQANDTRLSYWAAATGGIQYAGGSVGIGTATPATNLEVVGALRLSGTGADTATTPVGSSVPSKINVPPYDPGSYGQVVFMGIPASSQASSRVLSIADARTVAHQPSINLFSPDEAHYFGLSFDGSNAVGYLKSDVAIGLRPGGTVDALTALASGNVGIGTTTPGSALHVNGIIRATQICYTDGTNCKDISAAWSGGTVTSVTGTAPIVISGSASVPNVTVSAATTGASGVVTLAADGGTTASTVVQATDARLANSRAPNGAAGGDLSGNYPNPGVGKISGKTLNMGAYSSGQVLKYDGTDWTNAALSSADLTDASNLLKVSNMPANCAAGSSLTFSSPSGAWVCTAVSGLDAAAIASGTIAAARLPSSATAWGAATGGINYAGGNVGVGTTTPTEKVDVAGNIKLSGETYSKQVYVRSLTIPDGFAIGDYWDIVQAAPQSAGGSNNWEVHASGTRNGWTEGTTYMISGSHATDVIWRAAAVASQSGYVSAATRCFSVDFNGNSTTPRFRLRAIKASASCGIAGTSIPMIVRIRSVGSNSAWTELSSSGSGATVTGVQSMGLEWNVYTGDARTNAGTLAIHAHVDGNVGIGTTTPATKLDVAGDIKATGGGTIGVTRVIGTYGSTTTNLPSGTYTYLGDNITLPAGNWIVYYDGFYDADGVTPYGGASYNHPGLSTTTSSANVFDWGGLNTCPNGGWYCPFKQNYMVSTASTATFYVIHMLSHPSSTAKLRGTTFGHFYAIKVN